MSYTHLYAVRKLIKVVTYVSEYLSIYYGTKSIPINAHRQYFKRPVALILIQKCYTVETKLDLGISQHVCRHRRPVITIIPWLSYSFIQKLNPACAQVEMSESWHDSFEKIFLKSLSQQVAITYRFIIVVGAMYIILLNFSNRATTLYSYIATFANV